MERALLLYCITLLHWIVLQWLGHLARQGGWQPWRETWETEPGTTADWSRGDLPSHQRQIKFGLGVASSKKTESCGSWQREGPPNTSLLWHNLKCINCFSGKIPSANIIFPLSLSKLSSPEGNLILSQNSIRELNTNSWKSSNDVKRDFRSFLSQNINLSIWRRLVFSLCTTVNCTTEQTGLERYIAARKEKSLTHFCYFWENWVTSEAKSGSTQKMTRSLANCRRRIPVVECNYRKVGEIKKVSL